MSGRLVSGLVMHGNRVNMFLWTFLIAIFCTVVTKASDNDSKDKTTKATAVTTTTTTAVGRLEPTSLGLGVTLPDLTDPGANTQIFVDLMKVIHCISGNVSISGHLFVTAPSFGGIWCIPILHARAKLLLWTQTIQTTNQPINRLKLTTINQ